MEDQMQRVLQLMRARAAGEASNEQVEEAVEQLLHKENGTRETPRREVPPPPEIDVDEEDYDEPTDEAPPPPPPEEEKPVRRKRGRPRKKRDETQLDWTRYQDIPLGKQGAQMMTTFGDDKQPSPKAVEATLLGARKMLQTAIQDARHVRRQQQKVYKAAKQTLKAYKPKKPEYQQEWSHELVYRAMIGHDQLAYDPKCGFDIEEIRHLYTEEMNAYTRWNELHAQAQTKSENREETESAAGESTTEETPITTLPTDPEAGGHLQTRAAQFDVRTDRMEQDWYMKFSEVRQGSFLPRRSKQSEGEKEWEENRGRRGRRESGVWAHMSAITVRFLHWVGFDPQSALPPPNEDTTHALAFLGYDFFGRIVEKAIFLRNVQKQRAKGLDVDENNILLELEEGEKLRESDIQRAMEDPDIKPVPLYGGESNKKLWPQLYFGPGFEDRLEMELEEMVPTKDLSEEEKRLRQEEDELFAKLSAPPAHDGVASLLDKDGDDDEDQKPAASKRRRSTGKES